MSCTNVNTSVDVEAEKDNVLQKEENSTLTEKSPVDNDKPCTNDSNICELISSESISETPCTSKLSSNDIDMCHDNLTSNKGVAEGETQNTGDNIGASKEEKSLEQSFCQMVIGEEKSVIKQPECSLKLEEKSPELQKPITDVSVTSSKQIYRLKWIEWHAKKTPIVTQNENGPCPLIAIANILLLRGKIHLRNSMEKIESGELMDYIGDAIMESIPKDLKGPSMLNYEQNMHDAIAILPQLHTGLDVNIKFTGVQHFEYTPECIIFDLLNIPLYHGWLVDPQCQETVDALGNCGYNQLVEKIILNKCSPDPDKVTEALIAEQFLERTASQLTYHGLCELNSAMKQEELAVLFRNNHFSTILKRKNELFQLVTDQGFLHESRVVWETLCNIEGDGQFVDALFATVPPKSADGFIPDPILTEEQQINQDEELARRIKEEQSSDAHPSRAPSPSVSTPNRMPSPGAERGKKGAVCNVI